MSTARHQYTRVGSSMYQDGQRAPGSQNAWAGWVVFAALMMALIGLFHLAAGFLALFKDDYYTTSPRGLAISTNFTAWGWTHIVIGAVVGLAAGFLLMGKLWARIVTVLVALLSILIDFVYLPLTPVWSTISITLTVFSIYAVVVHGRDTDLLE